MTSPYEDWWDNYAFPLHAAVDEANDLPPDTPVEKRLALIVEKCPWVRERFASPTPKDHNGEAIELDHWIDVEGSSNVEAYRFETNISTPGEVTVFIRFKGGAVYSYAGVPYNVAIDIKLVDSVGRWVNTTLVNGGYTSTKVE